MKAKYFGAWPPNNISEGGQRYSLDEYNKAFKGDPYNLTYKKKKYRNSFGYMSFSVPEYNRVSEIKDMTAVMGKQTAGAVIASRALRLSAASAKRKRLLSQVVVLIAGSIMITAAYQAAKNRPIEPQPDAPAAVSVTEDVNDQTDNEINETLSETEPETEPETEAQTETASETNGKTSGGSRSVLPAAGQGSSEGSSESATEPAQSSEISVSWDWSDDYKSATLIVKDSSGNTKDKVKADVSKSKKAATCKKSGKITYTAKAEYDGKTYTDSKSKSLSALGHKFDSGKEITLDDGSPAMEFICERCNEHFTIKNSLDEE